MTADSNTKAEDDTHGSKVNGSITAADGSEVG